MARKLSTKKTRLRLVSSDDRVLALRDHLLPLVRDLGTLELQDGSVRLVSLTLGPWTFNHWTPFNDVGTEEAASPGYRQALKRQHEEEDLPYGFEVWRGLRVLSLLWSDAGEFKIVCFVPGPWQDEALAL